MPHLLKPLHQLLFAGLQFFVGQLAGGQLLTQLKNRCVFRVRCQQGSLFSQAALTLRHTFHAGFQLLDARLQHFGLALRLGRAQVEAVPLLLPAVHGLFGHFQRGGGLFGGGTGEFLLGLKHVQLFTQGRQQGAVMPQVRLGLQARAFGFAQVILQLAQTLLAMLNALLDAGNITPHRIEASLHQIEAL